MSSLRPSVTGRMAQYTTDVVSRSITPTPSSTRGTGRAAGHILDGAKKRLPYLIAVSALAGDPLR